MIMACHRSNQTIGFNCAYAFPIISVRSFPQGGRAPAGLALKDGSNLIRFVWRTE